MGNGHRAEEFCVFNTAVHSGIRSCGRTTDNREFGRKNAGIFYVFSGEARFYRDGRDVISVSDGDLLFLPKGVRYKMEYSAPRTTYVLINFETADRQGREISLFEDITPLGREEGVHRVASIMANLEFSAASKTVGAVLRRKELLYRLLEWVYASKPDLSLDGEVDSKILEGVRLLEQTYLENLPISTYAEACHIPINAFRSLFQKQFGTSPVKYRNALRVERAKELLRDGSLSVAEAAYASGFENIGYFCRTYRNLTGEAPGDTKKRNQSTEV